MTGTRPHREGVDTVRVGRDRLYVAWVRFDGQRVTLGAAASLGSALTRVEQFWRELQRSKAAA